MALGQISVNYRGALLEFHLDLAHTSVREFAAAVAAKTGVGIGTVKFAAPGRKLIKADESADKLLDAVGLHPGVKLLLLGSPESEVEAVRASRDLPGLAGFDHELRVQAARRRPSSVGAHRLPSGPYTFAGFETWDAPGLSPPPPEALKLLHKLAADPGIVGIMEKHRWRVGKLGELPPEGKVGVSPVCLLGVNINAGQEIKLRLRTDDLKGFRRYLSIRQTLCHELAHMVFSEHNLDFKRLNSQLCKECESMSATAGTRLAEAAEGWALEAAPQSSGVMAATAQSSGKTLRELAGDVPLPPENRFRAAWQESIDQPGIQALGHRDSNTEAREEAAAALGAMPQPSELVDPPAAENVLPGDSSSPHEPPPFSQLREAEPLPLKPTEIDRGQDTDMTDTTAPEHRSEPRTSATEPSTSSSLEASEEYFRDVQLAVQLLTKGLEPHVAALALQTLATILKNALRNPHEAKFRKVRRQNPAFHARAGRHPGALELLQAAGFRSGREGEEEVLMLARNDPGLLWMALTACEAALQPVM